MPIWNYPLLRYISYGMLTIRPRMKLIGCCVPWQNIPWTEHPLDKTSQDKTSWDETPLDETSQDKTSQDKTSPGWNVPRMKRPQDETSPGWNIPWMIRPLVKVPLGWRVLWQSVHLGTDNLSPIFSRNGQNTRYFLWRFLHFKFVLLTLWHTLFIKVGCIILTANVNIFNAPLAAPGCRCLSRKARCRKWLVEKSS
jgi:hypothetical protein